MYVCMYVCMYEKKTSQGDFRLMSFTAGPCKVLCIYVCMHVCTCTVQNIFKPRIDWPGDSLGFLRGVQNKMLEPTWPLTMYQTKMSPRRHVQKIDTH